jgi:hypothetical protein
MLFHLLEFPWYNPKTTWICQSYSSQNYTNSEEIENPPIPSETNLNLFALKGLVKGKFVISCNDDFVPVRLGAEPFVEFANFRLKNDEIFSISYFILNENQQALKFKTTIN